MEHRQVLYDRIRYHEHFGRATVENRNTLDRVMVFNAIGEDKLHMYRTFPSIHPCLPFHFSLIFVDLKWITVVISLKTELDILNRREPRSTIN